MLSPGIVVILLLAVTAAAVRANFSWRRLIVSVVVLEVAGFGLLGLPGAAFLETLDPVMQRMGRNPITGDAAWPAAIMMSLLWPVALVPAYLAARSAGTGNAQKGLVALVVLAIVCLLIGVVVHGISA